MLPEIGLRKSLVCPDDLTALASTEHGFSCAKCTRQFPRLSGIPDLLPRKAFEKASAEGRQLNAYSASFSESTDSAWRYLAGTLINRLGNGYLYSWAAGHVERLSSGKPLAVLDAACGDGILRSYLAHGHEYVGTDFSLRPLLRAQRYRPADYVRADMNHLPFSCETFDAVVSLQALQYLSQPEQSVGQIARVLKPRGSFFLTVPNDECFKYRFQGIPKIQLQRFDHRNLPDLIEHHFEILEMVSRGLWLPAPRISLHISGVYPAHWGLSWTIAAVKK
jgi:SAM-dependent methyltransferase